MLASVVDAAKANQLGLLKTLLTKEGAPELEVILNKKDEDGRTAFHWACAEGHVDVAKFILDSCGDAKNLMRQQDDMGWSPLFSACSAGRVDVVRFLLGAKADANQRTPKGQLPLHYHKGNEAILELLLPRTSNIDRKDKYGSTAISRAVSAAKLEAVEMLIAAKADIHGVDAGGDTLLHMAASNKDDKMVRSVLCRATFVGGLPCYIHGRVCFVSDACFD